MIVPEVTQKLARKASSEEPLSEPTRYVAPEIAFWQLDYALGQKENLRRALAEAFGPISFQTLALCGALGRLLSCFAPRSNGLARSVEAA